MTANTVVLLGHRLHVSTDTSIHPYLGLPPSCFSCPPPSSRGELPLSGPQHCRDFWYRLQTAKSTFRKAAMGVRGWRGSGKWRGEGRGQGGARPRMWPLAPGTLVSRAFSFSATFLQILVTWWISELRKRFWVRYASISSWKKGKVDQQRYHKPSALEKSSSKQPPKLPSLANSPNYRERGSERLLQHNEGRALVSLGTIRTRCFLVCERQT